MKNNFNFNASIKVKDLDKMEKLLSFLASENVENKDTQICIAFKNLLNSFDEITDLKMFELIDAFANFYEYFLFPYCKDEIICKKFNEFDFEQVQYVMDKMKEIIYNLCGKYGM